MSFLANLRRNLFSPPYPWLPLGVFTVTVLSFILHPLSAVRDFILSDPDDYARLNQLVHWLGSNDWYDLRQPRLSPGDNTINYWSHLVDLPLAIFAFLFSVIMPMHQAITAAALIVPPILFGLLLLPVVTMMVRPLVPHRHANLASVMLIFAPMVIYNVTPGRVDHHAYQIAISGFAFASLVRIIYCPRGWVPVVLPALFFACGLWIGGEAFPAIILFGTGLTIVAAWKGGAVLQSAARFGCALALSALIILPIARRPSEWHLLEMTWFSSAYVIFAVLLGAVLILGWALGQHTHKRWLRMTLMAALSFFIGALFFYLVPKAIYGPYADFDALSAPLVLTYVSEAQPLIRKLHLDWDHPFFILIPFFQHLFLPLLALGVVLWNIACGSKRQRMFWALTGLFLLPMTLLTLFWQVRAGTFMQLFTIIPITWLLIKLWQWAGTRFDGRPLFWVEILAFCTLTLFPVVLIPGVATGKPLMPNMLLFPGKRPLGNCNPDKAFALLNDLEGYGKTPLLIMNVMNDGPAILFETPHSALSAPYNVVGNRDSFDFFNARIDKQAQSIVNRRKVDLVLICRNISTFYTGLNETTRFQAVLTMGDDGQLRVQSDKNHPTLIERLVQGRPPKWLKPIVIPFDKDYLLYEVQAPKG